MTVLSASKVSIPRRQLLVAAASAIGLPVLGSCSRAPDRLAFVGGLTGRIADVGIGGRDGTQLALERLAEAGGDRIELVAYDDQQDGELARSLVDRIRQDGHEVVVGPMTSAMAMAMVPRADAVGLTLISPTVTTSELEGRDDQFLRVVSSLSEYAARSADQHARRTGWKRFAIVRDDSNRTYTQDWTRHFKLALAKHGATVASEQVFTYGPGFSFEPLADRALADAPDAVMIVASAMDTARIAQALRQRTAVLPLLASEWAGTAQLITLGGRAVEGLFVTQFLDRESRAPAYLAFVGAFRARFGRQPGFAETAAFDAASVALRSLRERRRGEPLKAAVLRLRRFEGLQQTLEFTAAGDARRPVFITQVREGRFVAVH